MEIKINKRQKEIMNNGFNAMCELDCNYLTDFKDNYEDKQAKVLVKRIFKALKLGKELVVDE